MSIFKNDEKKSRFAGLSSRMRIKEWIKYEKKVCACEIIKGMTKGRLKSRFTGLSSRMRI